MEVTTTEDLLLKIEELENRLAESEQLIDAIKAGEVDAFAIKSSAGEQEVYTLQSDDYAYRVLIEKFSEGAVNLTEDGLVVYTNSYFFELLETPYEKVVGSFIFDFIHPDSIKKFKNLFAHALTGNSKGEINLLVGNTSIPAYISLTSLQPRLATIGMIITDLTEKKKIEAERTKNEKMLAEKNQELERSNAELAAFSYIAAHDLNEPLRKIQLFSKRILDKGKEQFTTDTKDYFDRIISASRRMSNLLDALLEYSHTNSSGITLQPTNLNEVVEDVKNSLRESIKENNVEIDTAELPTLDLIPHQINQLFLNIISNAIKYRKRAVQPSIKITAELIPALEMQKRFGFTDEDYWKIDVRDNGIGFEQKYEHQIFELFQRLHGRSEYEGTGVGLAICKRVAQNHNGFITARGELGIGSTFTTYLPLKIITSE